MTSDEYNLRLLDKLDQIEQEDADRRMQAAVYFFLGMAIVAGLVLCWRIG